jgi:uncharacterized protein
MALRNLFTGKRVETTREGRSYIAVEGEGVQSMDRFRMIIMRDRIRSAAGAVLRRSADSDRIVTFLNKQVAYAGHVSFCEPEGESPLGPIRLLIETSDPMGVVNWIAGPAPERRKN